MVGHGVVELEEFVEEVTLFDKGEDFGFFGFEKLLVLVAAVYGFEGLELCVGFFDVEVDFLDYVLLNLDSLSFLCL